MKNVIETVEELAVMVFAFTYVMGIQVLWLPIWGIQRTIERMRGKR